MQQFRDATLGIRKLHGMHGGQLARHLGKFDRIVVDKDKRIKSEIGAPCASD